MPLSTEVDEFVKVASASVPRVSEIIAAFPDEDRAGAFELAERRYAHAARDFGCDEAETKRWVTALMRKLRALGQEAAERLPLHSIAIRGRPFLFGGRDRGGVVAQVINELRHGHKIDYAGDGHR
jgi:transposase-like protein